MTSLNLGGLAPAKACGHDISGQKQRSVSVHALYKLEDELKTERRLVFRWERKTVTKSVDSGG